MDPPGLLETTPAPTPEALKSHLLYELGQAAGLKAGGWQQSVLSTVLDRPIDSVAHLFSDIDATIGRDGIAAGFAVLLSRFVKNPILNGRENLPAEGPLLIVSNHPGAYDVLLIGATLDRRDLRILTSTTALYRVMTNWHRQTIEVGTTPEDGMRSIRESVRHLRDGGALLIFPSGLVEPDPDILPGAREAMAAWRPGVEALVNLSPRAAVVHAIASGVLAPRWINNPLLRLQRVDWQRRKLAEMIQVVEQMVRPQTEKLSPRLTFGMPITGEELREQAGGKALLPLLIERAQALLSRHMEAASAPAAGNGRPQQPSTLDSA
jgi:Acyltransferase